MKLNRPSGWKDWTLFGVTSLVVLFLLTWLLKLLFSPPDGASWVAAIQTISTLALVVITGAYVNLTRILVRSASNQSREALLLGAASDLTAALWDTRWAALSYVSKFPMKPGDPLPDAPAVTEAVKAMTDAAKRSTAMIPRLPRDLAVRVYKFKDQVARSNLALLGLVKAILRADIDKTEEEPEDNTPSWEAVKAAYEATPENEMSWPDLVNGAYLIEVSDASQDLMDAVSDYINKTYPEVAGA